MRVQSLDEASFDDAIANAPGLVVVEFFAPWCRTCKAVAPQYDRLSAKLQDSAAFYKVDFRENKRLAFRERVVMLPTMHFYLAGVGRVNRFTVTSPTFNARCTQEVESFVREPSGGPSRVDLLRSLSAEMLRPLVRYKELVSVLNGLSSAPTYLEKEGETKTLALQEDLRTDERRLAYLEEVFCWIDKDGNGSLDGDELEAAVAAVSKEGEDGELAAAALLEGIAEGNGGRENLSITLDEFIRIMTCKAAAEFATPDTELLPAFAAMDVDGGGTISKEEMLTAVERLFKAMPDRRSPEVSESTSKLEEAFHAFDFDDSGEIDYEEFVAMVSTMNGDVEDADASVEVA